MQFGFVIDNRKCIGCHACTVACKAEHEVPVGVNRTWVKYIEKGIFPQTTRHFSVMRCNHCADAPCVEICPVTALYRRPDGIVDFDNRRCIGCKACMQACPYDALYIDPQNHTAAKCNYCAHRVDLGLEPACVNVCPEHAIVSGDLQDPASEIAQLVAREQVTVRKGEKGTDPQLFYIDGDAASLDASRTQAAADYLWSSQESGVGHFARFAEQRKGGRDGSPVGERRQVPPPEASAEEARRVYDAPDKGVLWGWEVSGYIWTKALSAGLFLAPFLLSRAAEASAGVWSACLGAALFFLALTGALLVKDLDKPARFAYVLLRPQWRSWLVRGAWIIGAYAILLTLLLALALSQWSWGEAMLRPGGAVALLMILTALAAAATAAYTAYLLAQAKGRDLWQSPLAVLKMFLHAPLAGTAALALASPWIPLPQGWIWLLAWMLSATLLLHLALLGLELTTPHATRDASRAAEFILRGRLAPAFWGGAVVCGGLIPLALLLGHTSSLFDLFGWALPLAGLLVLVGLYFSEHAWVRAPQWIRLS
ncbi:MAG TPA: 4Fe-4S dicluster domain-containing protein [Acidobacteriota bacterium]|nr:4Fe-4S dicluster domain-containing protein [Acidobacteriota bacterium]